MLQRQEGDVVRDVEFRRRVPSNLIEDQHGMCAGINGAADLFEMRFHRRGVAIWHDKPRALASGGTDRAEDICPFGALVVRARGRVPRLAHPLPGRRMRAFGREGARDLVFLTDARVCREYSSPDSFLIRLTPATTILSWFRLEGSRGASPTRRGSFSKVIDGQLILGMVAGAR